MKLTVRLSKSNKTILQLLKAGHGLTGPISNWGNISGAELYFGMAYSNPPPWIAFLNNGVTTAISSLNSSGAVAILFIPISNRYIVYTFGICHFKINLLGFERDFGLKVVLNMVHPDRLKSVDSKIIDTIVTNRRTQLSKENRIEDFGFDIERDLLGGVVGRPTNVRFATALGGSDSLTIHCAVAVSNLASKSADILTAYQSTTYRTNYAWIDNIKAIKDQNLINILDAQLVTEFNSILAGATTTNFQLASPTIVDFQTIDHYKISGYRSRTEFPLPDIGALITDLNDKLITVITLQNLQHYTIDGVDGGGGVATSQSLYNWIVTETTYSNNRFILSEGTWFEISPAYYAQVQGSFLSILNNRREFSKVGTTTESNEENYLENYAITADEMILDKQFLYTYGGRNRIEACDIYNRNSRFIHVKDSGASSKLSHLFNQGFVSASALLGDIKFRQDLKRKLSSNPVLAATITSPIVPNDYTIVYRILKSGSNFGLPFFTKIVVNETRRKIKGMGYKFKLEWVEKV